MMNEMTKMFVIDDMFYFLEKRLFCLTTVRDYQSNDYNEIMLRLCLNVKNIVKINIKENKKST